MQSQFQFLIYSFYTGLINVLLNLNYIKLFFKFSRENSRTNYSGNSIVMPEDIGESFMKVGKIIFDTGQVLGKGCEGTFVYKYVIFLICL